jgi:Zn finger protein HypA/HybF involved in hydrogenase expression
MLSATHTEVFEADPARPVCRQCNIPMWLVTYAPKIIDDVEKEERAYQCEVCGCKQKVVIET